MRLDRLDVFHFPAPLMSSYCPIPAVVTFHDLAALSIEAEQTEKERRYLVDALDAGQRAAALIAVSDSAAQEVRRHLERHDITVIHEGVDARQFTAQQNISIRKQFQLENGYILCVGTLQARKNHVRLIQAFEQIQARIPHSLVIAGGDGSGAAAVRDYLAAHPNLRVKLLGYVEEGLLPALYAGAAALALPSLWEGFGLPLLEAMICGTPVLTSNLSSLAEVVGDAAVLVDPRDTEDIARGLYTLLMDQALRARLIEAGKARAQQFSWSKAAHATADVYRQIANRR